MLFPAVALLAGCIGELEFRERVSVAEAHATRTAALERMQAALARADRARAALCEARDLAGTLFAMREGRAARPAAAPAMSWK